MKLVTKRVFSFLIAITMVLSILGQDLRVLAVDVNEEDLSVVAAQADSVQADGVQAEPNVSYGVLNYIYVGEPVVSTGDTQEIVASLGDTGRVDSAEITVVSDADGSVITALAKRIEADAALFIIPHVEDVTGGYTVESIKYTVDKTEYFVSPSSIGAPAKYGVNTKVDTNPSLYMVSDEESDCDEIEGISVQNLRSAAAPVVVDTLEEALEATNLNNTVAKKKGNIVIALDAGHGGTDSGAVRGALVERDINWKILTYCKAELEKYSGVQIFITPRDVNGTVTGRDVRCAAARDAGADIIVSFHINAGGGTGAEIWVPTVGTQVTQSAELSNKILAQLAALGLHNRGLKDGSDRGLGMVYYPSLYGIPGILIEHAFIDTDGAFLSSEANIKKMGEADAKGIAEYLKLSTDGSRPGDLYKDKAAKLSYTQDANLTKITLKATKVEKAGGLKFKVWSDTNGTDDVKWYTAKLSSKTWKKAFNLTDFATAGKYKVEAHVVREDGSTYRVGSLSFTPEQKASGTVSVKNVNEAEGTFNVVLSDVISTFGVKNVYAKVYNEKDTKVSKTYTATKNDIGDYTAKVDISDIDFAWGTYKAKVYIKDKTGKNITIKTVSQTLSKPAISVSTKLDADETKLTVTAKNVPGAGSNVVKSVRMRVWSDKNGKDDEKWIEMKKSGNSYKATATITDFKDTGKYNVYVYTTMKDGRDLVQDKTTVNVSDPVATASITSKNPTAGTFKIKLSDVKSGGGVKKVEIEVWKNSLTKSDKKTYTPTKKTDGTYVVSIDASKFDCADGKFYSATYITNGFGKRVKAASKNYTMTAPKAVIDSSISNSVNIKLSSNTIFGQGGKSLEKFEYQVYTSANGKDDLKKYSVNVTKENLEKTISISDHNYETGTYKVIAYATYANGKKVKVATKNVNVVIPDPIMGATTTNKAQLVRYYKANATYPEFYKGSDAPTIDDFAQIYIEECAAEGVRAEVAFAQAMKETGFMRYGGDVKIEQYNFAGIGATGGGVQGNYFPSVRIGVRAQVQHLKAYASTAPLNQECVDPRFNLVKRGTAITIIHLGIHENPYGGGWAAAVGYGSSIINHYMAKLLAS